MTCVAACIISHSATCNAKRNICLATQAPEAKELAGKYFLETLVRLHRAGEGAPYTGIKDEPVEPMVAMADKALADGSADELVKTMSAHLSHAVQEKFGKALEAKKTKDKSVEAGRAYVEAYVVYMHYVEGIHAAIMSAGAHGPAEAAAPGHEEPTKKMKTEDEDEERQGYRPAGHELTTRG